LTAAPIFNPLGQVRVGRWQCIHSGAQQPHFVKVMFGLITKEQAQRIQAALERL
jgi:hypothetical protein